MAQARRAKEDHLKAGLRTKRACRRSGHRERQDATYRTYPADRGFEDENDDENEDENEDEGRT
jgi:hypothetical protein